MGADAATWVEGVGAATAEGTGSYTSWDAAAWQGAAAWEGMAGGDAGVAGDAGAGACWGEAGSWQLDGCADPWLDPWAASSGYAVGGGWWRMPCGTAAALEGVSAGSAPPPRRWQQPPGANGSTLGPLDEHTAQVHFTKTHQVLAEILEAHPAAFDGLGSFLDLGCAPGGFASRLLEEVPSAQGFGVTLPVDAGGFPMLLDDGRLQVQRCDIMALGKQEELGCPTDVDACLADAQDLGRRTNSGDHRSAMRKGKGGKAGAARTASGTAGVSGAGVRAACAVLGIWAMTFQELLLGLGRLRAGGTFVFRFGWRGRGANEEAWYREACLRLFAVVVEHFSDVAPFKSEFSHQADSTFYTIATGFRRDAYLAAGLDERLRTIVEQVVGCPRAGDLPWCMETLAPLVTPDMRTRIEELLEGVGRLRAIGIATRRHLEAPRASSEAALWISPVPFSLTLQRIRERLERHGKIVNIRRRAHPIGVGADALVQFAQPAHAKAALEAISEHQVLGPSITARRLCDVRGH